MPFFKSAAIALVVATTGAGVCATAAAQTSAITVTASQSGAFIKKSKTLKGAWEVVQRGEKTFIVFSDDFKASRGPDLKVFLSPQSINDVTGKTAIEGAINIGELKKTKGTQEYELPAGVNLANYTSVLVHCEAYSVLWGGANL